MYLDHFGLSGPPFQLTPDPRFWFESRTHKKAMAYLGYGLAQAEGFITITGEIGAGKSTLAAHLLARIDPARLHAVAIVSTQVEGDDMLRLVAQRLGIATDGAAKASLLEQVEQRLEDEYRSGKRTLIVVDEAQNLPPSALEELRLLSNFQLGGRALAQILLLGQPEFRDRIAGPGLEQLRQRVIATHHLDPMGADEIAAYVRHRLELVEWSGRPDFTQDAWDALYRATGGVPRRLNQLLNRLLLHAAVEELDLINDHAVEAVAEDLAGERLQPEPLGRSTTSTEEWQPSAADHWSKPAPLPEQEPDFLAEPQAEPQPEPAPAPRVFVAAMPEPSEPDPRAEARIAALEDKLAEQEATLRKLLTLMVDWAERDLAPWDQRTDRRAGGERRFHAV